MKKQIGIWLDLRNAHIITLQGNHHTLQVQNLKSEIDENQGGGGYRGKSPWAPSGGDNTRSVQERRHNEEKKYFERVAQFIPIDTDELVIFGPSEAKFGLYNFIKKMKNNSMRVVGVKSVDQMSEGQMINWIREFFKANAPRKFPVS